MDIANFLRETPAVIWVAILAPVLAFGGVLLSNAIALHSLTRRLQHEAREAALKRKSDIRKEVYLKAVEELINANAYLTSLVQKTPPDSNLASGMLGFTIAGAKLQMLMEQEDALAVADLTNEYGKIFIRFLPMLGPMQKLQNNIQVTAKRIERTDSEISRILSQQTAHNESGNSDQANFERLQQSFNSQQALAAKFRADQAASWVKLIPLQREASMLILSQIREIQPQVVTVIMAMRRDFEVSGSEEIFLRRIQSNMDDMRKVLDQSLVQIDAQLATSNK